MVCLFSQSQHHAKYLSGVLDAGTAKKTYSINVTDLWQPKAWTASQLIDSFRLHKPSHYILKQLGIFEVEVRLKLV